MSKPQEVGEKMLPQTPILKPDLALRKSKGREYLSAGKYREALQIFLEILQEYPDDVSTLITLGDLYLACDQDAAAMKLYTDAQRIQPDNPDVVSRLRLAKQQGKDTATNVYQAVPTDPAAIARLLQRLTHSPEPIPEHDLLRAAELLQTILSSPDPAGVVNAHLQEIDSLLPALLELNIRQARADGQPALAEGLVELQTNIHAQMESRRQPVDETRIDTTYGETSSMKKHFRGKVFILTAEGKSVSPRLALAAEGLAGLGCTVTTGTNFIQAMNAGVDVVLTSSPHRSAKMMETLAAFAAAQVPVVLDLEDDYEEMPVNHPDYAASGLGNPAHARAYMAALMLASRIVVPSAFFSEALQAANYRVDVVRDAWSAKSGVWNKPSAERGLVNIGWIDEGGGLEDLALMRRVLVRVLRQFPETQIVLAGNMQAVALFDSIPLSRRIYLPSTQAEDLPYLLGQIDILVVPQRNMAYNRSRSSALLMKAGIKRIPWLAMPLPEYQEWKAGGICTASTDEWFTYLSHLITDPEIRRTLGEDGYRKAASREIQKCADEWRTVIEKTLAEPGKLAE